ncbi:bifunctional protein GAL10 [Trichodelitschia bisporula]|uniref:Bifunctional protein GAL10 n=1 Tax=Trichodelitschia bisporula TaxID=703511 RepID=A0A6G1HWH4_9PEZI|nr:bifunctional protein GAL10 [Trichodelitschia bisporula]
MHKQTSISQRVPGLDCEHVRFLRLGAIIQEFRVGGVNIVQNFPDEGLYREFNDPYFGETIGRVANRISGARIKSLNGREYPLAANNGPNNLHGGNVGWGKRVWDVKEVERNRKKALMFTYLSPDGEEGFPGAVEVRVWYTPSPDNDDSKTELDIEYEAELVGNDEVEETVVAMTNHSYFNLANTSSITGTQATLSSALHQVVDSTSIPTGPLEPYPGIKANVPFILGPSEPDIDHCFILTSNPARIPIDTRSLPLRTLASFSHPTSGINLEIQSTEPAFQLYTGKYISVPAVGGLPARGARSGFCVEPSRYVNAINVDEWRGMVILRRGQKYGSRTVYRGWKA